MVETIEDVPTVGDLVDWDRSGTREHPTIDNVTALAREVGLGPFHVTEVRDLGKNWKRFASGRYAFILSKDGVIVGDARGGPHLFNSVWFTNVN